MEKLIEFNYVDNEFAAAAGTQPTPVQAALEALNTMGRKCEYAQRGGGKPMRHRSSRQKKRTKKRKSLPKKENCKKSTTAQKITIYVSSSSKKCKSLTVFLCPARLLHSISTSPTALLVCVTLFAFRLLFVRIFATTITLSTFIARFESRTSSSSAFALSTMAYNIWGIHRWPLRRWRERLRQPPGSIGC